MEGQLAVPFHFAAEFLILAVSTGACLDSIRRAKAGGGWHASAQALGFAVLAAAQVLHGARIAHMANDGALVAVSLRAVAFALIALGAKSIIQSPLNGLGVSGVLPVVAATPGLFQPGPSAQLALVPAVAAAVASVRGFAAHRRDQDPASFAFTAAFATFAAGEVVLALTPPAGGTMLAVSHALRFAGALLLSRYLASAIGRSVRLRFVAAFVVALTVLVLVLSAALNAVISRNLTSDELSRVEVTAKARVSTLKSREESTRQTVLNLARLLQNQVPTRQQLTLFACLAPEQDFFVSVSPDRKVVAGVGKTRPKDKGCDFRDITTWVQGHLGPLLPEAIRLGAAGSGVTQYALSKGGAGSSFEIFLPNFVVSVAAAPVGTVPNKPSGALVTGRILSGDALASDRRQETRAFPEDSTEEFLARVPNSTIIVGGDPIATTIKGGAKVAADLAKCGGDEMRSVVEENGETLRKSCRVGGAQSLVVFVPLRSSNNQPIGVFAASVPQTGLVESQMTLNRLLFIIALAAAAVAATIAWAAGGRVTRPIFALTLAAEAVRRGDLSARAPAETEDELGTLGRSFNDMAASLDRSTADLRAAAVTEGELRGQMEAIMQSMGDALIATDTHGRIVTANRAAENLTGIPADRMRGRALAEVVLGTDSAGHRLAETALVAAVATGTLDGETRTPVALTAAPLRDAAGADSGRVIVLRDMSAEVQAERMKSEFLSNVSHELRTPLTPIKGYTEILKRKKFPKEKAESFLDGILESTARLERIVEILVDFAAMEAGRLKPHNEAVAVKPFLEKLVGRWKERGNGRFAIHVAPSLPPILADPRLLAKSLDELIDNAVKFSPGGPRVDVDVEPVLSSNGSRSRKPVSIRISVRDKGLGIAAEKLPSLFQDFRQLDGSETREYGGLGLGLAYVKRVASVLGGDVAATSVPGRGSTFSLTLPVADTTSEKPGTNGSKKGLTSKPVPRRATR